MDRPCPRFLSYGIARAASRVVSQDTRDEDEGWVMTLWLCGAGVLLEEGCINAVHHLYPSEGVVFTCWWIVSCC